MAHVGRPRKRPWIASRSLSRSKLSLALLTVCRLGDGHRHLAPRFGQTDPMVVGANARCGILDGHALAATVD